MPGRIFTMPGDGCDNLICVKNAAGRRRWEERSAARNPLSAVTMSASGRYCRKKILRAPPSKIDFKISLGYATLIQGLNPFLFYGFSAVILSTASDNCGEVGPLAPRQIGGSRAGSGVSAGNRSRVEHMQFCVPHR